MRPVLDHLLFFAVAAIASCSSSAEDATSAAPTETAPTGGSDPATVAPPGVAPAPTPSSAPPAAPGDEFSFVVVGCNRVEKADITDANPSTANVEQLTRTFQEVAALSPPPKYFFFAGDMVYGFEDGPTLASELTAWLALYEASPLPAAGVKLVPVQGNHESQAKSGSSKLAYVDAETTWVSVMAKYIRGSNGPGPGGDDMLQTDQSQLTYSFDDGGIHFVVLNTDPVGADWQVPAYWVQKDLAAAHAKHVFAIGHKPAYPSSLSQEGGLSMYPDVRDMFWASLEDAHAEAMLAAHNHLWFKTRPNKTWQIVAGNGGSLLESTVTGADAYYGFTRVAIRADGTVTATSYGRDVPSAGYTASSTGTTTTIRDSVDLTWR